MLAEEDKISRSFNQTAWNGRNLFREPRESEWLAYVPSWIFMGSYVTRWKELEGKIYGVRKIEIEFEDSLDDRDKVHEAASR